MTYTLFEQTYTHALEDKNFREWHQGIPFYGFWAILIDDQEFLNFIRKAQQQLQYFFLPGYQRQPHITLNAAGLISETHFSNDLLQQQINELKALRQTKFEITIGHPDSFSTAAYLSIQDESQTLRRLNKALDTVISDSPAQVFTPHITLGLYRYQFHRDDIRHALTQIDTPKLPDFSVSKIQFCRYKTHEVQGQIEVVEEVTLQG